MSLVTGGCTALNSEDLCTTYTDTTELLSAGASAWVYTAPLPSARMGLRGASINNRVIISGEWLYVATMGRELVMTKKCSVQEAGMEILWTAFYSLMARFSSGRKSGN